MRRGRGRPRKGDSLRACGTPVAREHLEGAGKVAALDKGVRVERRRAHEHVRALGRARQRGSRKEGAKREVVHVRACAGKSEAQRAGRRG